MQKQPGHGTYKNCGPLPCGIYTMESIGFSITAAAIRLHPSETAKSKMLGLGLTCFSPHDFFPASAQAGEITVTTAQKMMEDCEEKGPFAMVNTLTRDGDKKWGGKQWDEVLEKIAWGDKEWIDTSA